MRYFAIIASLLLFSCKAFSADMAEAERCEKLGEVAEKASEMRISGEYKETATSSLLEIYDHPGSGLTANRIRAYVMWAYMAKMEPEKMRDFATAQCKQGS